MGYSLQDILRNASEDTKLLNASLLTTGGSAPSTAPPKMSGLEAEFLYAWEALGLPELKVEHGFHDVRGWRFDFAHLDAKVAIELEGIFFRGSDGESGVKSRHQTGAGYSGDCEKYNEATALGWAVFRFTQPMIQPDQLEMVAEFIERRLEEQKP